MKAWDQDFYSLEAVQLTIGADEFSVVIIFPSAEIFHVLFPTSCLISHKHATYFTYLVYNL